jgi:hypothetical protein
MSAQDRRSDCVTRQLIETVEKKIWKNEVQGDVNGDCDCVHGQV